MNSLTRNVYSTIAPIFYVSQLLGLMPLKYRNRHIYKLRSPFRTSVLCFLYAIFGVIVTVLHISSAPFYIIKSIYPYHYGTVPLFGAAADEEEIISVDNKQTVVMKIISPILSSVMSLTARLTGVVFLTRRLASFLQRIDGVDALLSALPTSGDVTAIYRDDFRLSLKIVVYMAIISVPINVWYLYNVCHSPDVDMWSLVWCFTLVWSNLSACACETQFITFAALLNRRYKAINRYLMIHTASYSEQQKTPRRHPLCRWKRNRIVPKVDKIVPTYNQKPTRRVYISDHTGGREQPSFLLGLELTRRCHTKLCDLLRYLSCTYQLQFVTSLSGCFMKTLFLVYFAIFGLVIGTGNGHVEQRTSDNEVEEILKIIFWILFYVFRFLTIVFTATCTEKEANLTKCLLVDIDCRYLDEEVREEVTLFAEHTSSRRVEFSACSLFNLNTRLITSAIATGTTYLVILVQFHTPATTVKRDLRT